MVDHFNDSEYITDYDDEVCDKEKLVEFGSIAIPLFFSVVTILSLIGNTLVLVILVRYENLKSLSNIFILNLAISDLVFTAGLPFWAIYHIWGWVLPEILCNIVAFIFYTGFYSSILLLTIITIHRYLAVVHPLSEQSMQKWGYGAAVAIVVWVASIGAAMPSLILSAVILIPHKNGNSKACQLKTHTLIDIGTYQQNIVFLAAFGVMSFCHVQIVRKISRSRSHMKYRTVKLIFCIVAVFFFGWIPYNVVIFLRSSSSDDCNASTVLDYAFFVCRFIAFSHCCLNPVLYALVGVKFRSHLKSCLHQTFFQQSRVEEKQTKKSTIPMTSMKDQSVNQLIS